MEMANRIFFKLYQCANMLHKTGSRAVQDEGLTTQQWAVLGYVRENSTLMFDPTTGNQGGEGMTLSGQWWI